jgi:hypothetical protein
MLVGASACIVHADDDAFTGDELAALMMAQIESIEAVWFRGRWENLLQDENGARVSGIELEGEFAFNRNGDRFRCDYVMTEPIEGEPPRTHPSFQVWDGETAFKWNKITGLGSIEHGIRAQGSLEGSMMSGCGHFAPGAVWFGLHEAVPEARQIDRLSDDAEGRPRIRMIMPPEHPAFLNHGGAGIELHVTLEPGLDYMPVRVEAVDAMIDRLTDRLLARRHSRIGDVWIPMEIVVEGWDIQHPDRWTDDMAGKWEQLYEALEQRGLDAEAEMAMNGPMPENQNDPKRIEAIREALQEVFGPDGLPFEKTDFSRTTVTSILGVNDDVPDTLFVMPFTEGAVIYDTLNKQSYIIIEGGQLKPIPSDKATRLRTEATRRAHTPPEPTPKPETEQRQP